MAVDFQFDFDRTRAAITYLASKNVPELTTYKLLKLIFWADKYHLVKYSRPITGDYYCAMPDGPVPSHTYDLLKAVLAGEKGNDEVALLAENLEVDTRFQYPRLSARRPFDASELSRSDIAALDRAVEIFGHMDYFALRTITHEVVAFKKAWEGQRPGNVRSWPMAFEDFFEDDPAAIAGALDEMIETDALRKAFA